MNAMTGRISSVTAVGLASLAFVPAASAQVAAETPEVLPEYSAATPTPTATPTPAVTPTPTPLGAETEEGHVGAPPEDAPKRVRRVYRDYRRDAIIEPCDHTLNTLRDTRDSATDEFEEEFPDFLASVEASIAERREIDCKALAAQEAAEKRAAADDAADQDAGKGTGETTASPGGSGTGATVTPAPTVAPLPIDPLPAEPDAADDTLAPDPLPATETPAPLPEEVPPPVAPAPVAPAPVATPAPAAVSREPAAAPAPVYGLAAGGGLLALAGLAAPLLGARGGSRLAAFQHSWAEAGFRVRGTWQDFRDWLRVGR